MIVKLNLFTFKHLFKLHKQSFELSGNCMYPISNEMIQILLKYWLFIMFYLQESVFGYNEHCGKDNS